MNNLYADPRSLGQRLLDTTLAVAAMLVFLPFTWLLDRQERKAAHR